ncbi:MAG: hypothetical protein IPL33_06455 [Sphingobacteriales bacterium]|nr:hypothetical protein [Sphingobacteriales bacterium]
MPCAAIVWFFRTSEQVFIFVSIWWQQYQQQRDKILVFAQVWNIVEFTEQLSETVILRIPCPSIRVV